MVIQDIRTGRISLPLRHPFKTALRTVTHLEDVVVMVVADDGQVGYGEAPPTAVITGDTMGSVECAVRDFIRPALVGMEVEDLDGVMKKLQACMVKNTTAKAAVDMAIYDLWGKRYGIPVWRALGGAQRELETDLTISVNPVEEMVRDSLEAVERGYRILKIKVGKDPKADVERMAAIREAVGPDVKLRVDANQGWRAKEAVAIISAMEDKGLDIDLVEQPVPAHDLEGMVYVTSRVQTPILADESVFSPADAVEIIRRGGRRPHQHQAHEDRRHLAGPEDLRCGRDLRRGVHDRLYAGVPALCGRGAHLAAGRSVITRCDLDGPSLCAEDPFTGGPVFDEAVIRMSDDPGIGVTNIPCKDWQ